jgi:hypothetical protein
MTRTTAIATLFLAALLEAGGDALMRAGLHKNLTWQRASLFMLAAIVLFAYGWTVNASQPTPTNPPPVLSAPVFRFLRSSVGVSAITADATYSHSSLPLVALERYAEIASFLQASLVMRGSCGSFLLPI